MLPSDLENLRGVIEAKLQDLCSRFGANLATLHLYDEAEDRLVFPAGFGITHPRSFGWRPSRHGPAANILQVGKPVFAEDAEHHEQFRGPFTYIEEIKSGAAFPFFTRTGSRCGILFLNYRTAHAFSPEEKESLTNSADSLARELETSLTDKLWEDIRSQVGLYREQATLQEIVDTISEMFRDSEAIIWLFEPAEGLVARAHSGFRGFSRPVWASVAPLEQQNLITQAFRSQDVRFGRVGDEYWPRDDLHSEGVKERRWQSAWAFPLETHGVLVVYTVGYSVFTQREETIGLAFARYAATMVQNDRLLQSEDRAIRELARRTQNLRALNELGGQLTADIHLHEEQILELVYSHTSRLMNTENMSVALYDEPTDTMRFGLAMRDGIRVDVSAEKGWGPRLGLNGKGKTNEIIRTREPILLSTRKEEKEWYAQPGRERYIEEPRTSWLGVPMMIGDKLLGVIDIYHLARERVYGPEDLWILQAIANYAAVALENAHMFYSVDRRRRALIEFGRSVSSGIHGSEQSILKLIREQASALMDTDNMYIALYDEPTDTVRFGLVFVDGKRADVEERPEYQPRRAGKGKTEEIIRTKASLFHATRSEGEAWYHQTGHQEYWGTPFASWLGVPMRVGQRVLGVIVTYHPTEDYAYSGDDREILQAMANQAAIAFANAHMYGEVDRRRRALIEFGRSVSSGIHGSEQSILKLIREQASALMDTDNMYIALYDEPTDTVRFGLVFVDGKRADVEERPEYQPRRAGKGKTEEIIRTKASLFHATRSEGEAWYHQTGHQEYWKRLSPSWLGVPMLIGERVLGTIATYHPTREWVYSGDDRETLQAMANQAAVALDNAAMYSTTEKRRSQLETVRRVANAITAELDPQRCMEQILDEIVKLLDSHYATIQLVDESTSELVIRAQRGVVETRLDPELVRIKVGKGITGTAAQKMCTIRTGNVEEIKYYLDYIQEGIRSEMATPLIEQDKVIGVLNVEDQRADAFDQDDQDLFELVAEQVVIAIQNARKAEAAWKEQERRAEAERLDYLGLVAGGVAHRVGSRGGLIRLHLSGLRKQISPERKDIHPILDKIERDNDYLIALSEALFIPVHAGETSVGPVDVDQLLQEAVQRSNIPSEIELSVEQVQVPNVVGSRWLVDVFVEVITNSVRALSESEERKLTISPQLSDARTVAVVFSDTGCGISLDEQPKLFRLFYTQGGSTEVPSRGGYGLWYSRSIARRMGGDIQIESEEGKGTKCTVFLPVAVEGGQA